MTRFPSRAALLSAALLTLCPAAAGCFAPPPPPPPPPAVEPADADLSARVAAALDGDADAARLYAAFYRLLADRTAAGADATTADLAAVAGRAADLLALPGKLSDVVGEELDPVLNPPGPLTPDRRAAAVAAFARLADACGGATR